jgi:TRAP-type C4-dicarboxylate transport system substrate-binding protein
MSAEAKLEMYERIPAFEEEFANNGVRPLLMFSSGSYDLQSNVPISTLADFDGKKIAAAGSTLPKWLEPIGAVPVSMPGADRYVSLQRKTVDGSMLPMSSAEGDRHYEVAKYYTYLDLGAPSIMYLIISQDLWDSLTSSERDIFLQAAEETQEWLPAEYAKQQAEGVATFEEAGVTFYTMSETDKAAWAQALPDLPAQWAQEMEAQGLPGWEIVETYIEITKDAGYSWPREWGQR